MKLSVIVPVYNVENYIEKCVMSILNQSFKDLEIILVNDGSLDKSGEICEKIKEKYENVEVYHKSNGGLSDARNYGILKSKGEYITFVDSDDYIKPDVYLPLMNLVERTAAEIVIGQLVKYYPNEKKFINKQRNEYSNKLKLVTGLEYLNESISEKIYSAVAVKGIYKKELLLENNLFFQKGLLHEDELWTPQILLKAKKVIDSNMNFYVHVDREGSITNNKDNAKNVQDLVNVVYSLEKTYNLILSKKDSKILRDYLVTLYLNALNIGKLLDKDSEYKVDYKFLKRNARTFRNLLKSILMFIDKGLYKKINQFEKNFNN
ncbi:glycosyltransferase [Aerococcus urinaeequi]|uniref:glycosyltransferase n=1 Tax=Aerococcus urinaeequi TaxID=51665 RepID=UPI003D6C4A61